MHQPFRLLLTGGVAALFWAAAGGAQAQAYVNATVGGELAPGVYGRVNIGNAPPPPVLYAQPVLIQRQPVLVQQQPLYLYVPPGHAKNWRKHCGHYHACGQPVYFVKEPPRRGQWGGSGRRDERWDGGGKQGRDSDHDRGHGRGHDKDRHGRHGD